MSIKSTSNRTTQILNNQDTEAAEVVFSLAAIRYQVEKLKPYFLNQSLSLSDSEFIELASNFIEIVSSEDVPAFIARQAYEPGKIVFFPFFRLKPFFAALRAKQRD